MHLNGDRPLPAFDPEAIPARTRYLNRRVKLLKNLLRWRKYAGGRLGLNALVSRLVEGCIVPVAETGWDVGGAEISRTVSDNFRGSYLLPSRSRIYSTYLFVGGKTPPRRVSSRGFEIYPAIINDEHIPFGIHVVLSSEGLVVQPRNVGCERALHC